MCLRTARVLAARIEPEFCYLVVIAEKKNSIHLLSSQHSRKPVLVIGPHPVPRHGVKIIPCGDHALSLARNALPPAHHKDRHVLIPFTIRWFVREDESYSPHLPFLDYPDTDFLSHFSINGLFRRFIAYQGRIADLSANTGQDTLPETKGHSFSLPQQHRATISQKALNCRRKSG